MKLIIILGAPGVGKGTQCALLSQRLGYKHISTGSIIRKEIQSQSPLGLRVKTLVDSGNLVDDESIFLCLENALSRFLSSEKKNFNDTILLDGLPRNLSQAQNLNQLIEKVGFKSVQVVCLEANRELLVQRFQNRLTCSSCQNVQSLQGKDTLNFSGYSCQACGTVGSMVRRKDDEAETVQYRLNLYEKETLPVASFYQEKEIIYFVDALMPPEFVYVRVASFVL